MLRISASANNSFYSYDFVLQILIFLKHFPFLKLIFGNLDKEKKRKSQRLSY